MKFVRILMELLIEARLALSVNRGRSLLSVLGITIGIAAVMTVNAVTVGGRAFVMNELETFGLRSVWVYRLADKTNPQKRNRKGSGIDTHDLQVLERECCSAVRRLSPVVLTKQEIIVQNGNRYSDASLQGVNADFVSINNDSLRTGRSIRTAEVRNLRPVVLIGEKVVKDLFPDTVNPVGRNLRILGREYRIVGILQEKSRDLLASIGSDNGSDVNNRILLPYTILLSLNGNADINYLQAEATSLEDAKRATAQIVDVLKRRHNGIFRYKSTTLASYIDTVDRILGGVTVMGIIAASAALLVGAIGVAGIMSTAVVERTREIGIRAAVGARRWHIMTQFVAEAILISLFGGLGGLIFGILAGVIVDLTTGFSLMPNIQGVLVALMGSILVGIGAGYFPARKAARMKPVDALRSDY